MNIVEKEAVEAAPQDTKEATPEDFTKKISDAFAQGEVMAKKIHETVLGQWFTMMKLSNLTGDPIRGVDRKLQFISQFFLLEEKNELGVRTFKVITDAKERLAFVESNKQMRLAEISTWDLIAQMIMEKVVDA